MSLRKKTQEVLPEPFRGGLTTVPALRPVGHGMGRWNRGIMEWEGEGDGGWIGFLRV